MPSSKCPVTRSASCKLLCPLSCKQIGAFLAAMPSRYVPCKQIWVPASRNVPMCYAAAIRLRIRIQLCLDSPGNVWLFRVTWWSVDVCGCLRVTGCPWLPVDVCVCLGINWLLVVVCGCLGLSGYLWLAAVVCECSREWWLVWRQILDTRHRVTHVAMRA